MLVLYRRQVSLGDVAIFYRPELNSVHKRIYERYTNTGAYEDKYCFECISNISGMFEIHGLLGNIFEFFEGVL